MLTLLRIFTLLTLALLGAPATAAIVELQGPAIAGLAGRDPATVDLAVYRDGDFVSLPHQWLPWSQGRAPWFQEDGDAERSQPADRIAAEDHLLVDLPDSARAAPAPLPDAVLGVFTLGTGDGARSVYALQRPPPAWPVTRRLHREPLALNTPAFQLAFEDDNLFRWGDFFYTGRTGPDGQPLNLLDSLKLRLSAGVFSAGARLTLTNENLDPEIRQVVDGPLATRAYVTTRVRVAGLPVLKLHNYFLVRDRAVAVHSRLTLPGFAATVLREPGARVTVDGNNLTGARLRTSWTGDREARVDGRLDDTERAMVDTPVPTDNWLWFGTGDGFDLLARLYFAEGFDTGARFIYQDDPSLDDEPERFPGQRPNVGFALDRIPFGQEFYFVAELYFSDGDGAADPAAYAARRLARPAAHWQPR